MNRWPRPKTAPVVFNYFLRYAVIVLVFLCAYCIYYFSSQKQIESQYTKFNQEYFDSVYQQIEKAILQVKNDIYLLKNDPKLRNFSGNVVQDDLLDTYSKIQNLKKLKTYSKYIDDVILYSPSGRTILTSDGSINGDLYFKSFYVNGKQVEDWNDVFYSGSRETYSISIRYASVGYESDSSYYSKLLYVDRSFGKNTDMYMGVLLDLSEILKDSGGESNLISHAFIAASGDSILLDEKYKITIDKDNEALADGRICIGRNSDQLVFYKYDRTRDWVFINAIDKKDMNAALGIYTQPLKVILAVLVIGALLLTLFILANTLREFGGLTDYMEKSFINNLSLNDFSRQWVESTKKFIGLNKIRKVAVILVEWKIKEFPRETELRKQDYLAEDLMAEALIKILQEMRIRFKTFHYSTLRKLYILDAGNGKSGGCDAGFLMERLNRTGPGNTGFDISYCASGVYPNEGIAEAIKEALYICENSPVGHAERVVIKQDTGEEAGFHLPENMPSILKNCISSHETRKLADVINDLIHKCVEKRVGRKNLNSVLLQINGILSTLVSEMDGGAKDGVLEQLSSVNALIGNLTVEGLKGFYAILAEDIIKCSSDADSGKSRLKELFIKYIDENYTKDICLETMAEQFNFSAKYASMKFKELTGENFSEYLKKRRILQCKTLLKNPRYKVNDVSELVGYTNVNNFIRHFKSLEGITPSIYKEHHIE